MGQGTLIGLMGAEGGGDWLAAGVERPAMPLSTLNDPIDVARASAALEAAWEELRPQIACDRLEAERERLGYIVASYTLVAADDHDLKRRAIEKFRQKRA